MDTKRDSKGYIIEPHTQVGFPNLAVDEDDDVYYWVDGTPPSVPKRIIKHLPKSKDTDGNVICTWHDQDYFVKSGHMVPDIKSGSEPTENEVMTLPLSELEGRMEESAMRIIYSDVLSSRDPILAKWIVEQRRGRIGVRPVGAEESTFDTIKIRVAEEDDGQTDG